MEIKSIGIEYPLFDQFKSISFKLEVINVGSMRDKNLNLKNIVFNWVLSSLHFILFKSHCELVINVFKGLFIDNTPVFEEFDDYIIVHKEKRISPSCGSPSFMIILNSACIEPLMSDSRSEVEHLFEVFKLI